MIFDFDGTIGDTEPFYAKNFEETMREFGVVCDEEDKISFIGFGPYDKVKILEKKYGITVDADAVAVSFRRKNVERFPQDASCLLFADVLPCLQACRERGLKLYICSNTDSEKVSRMISQMGIAGYFDGVSGKDLCKAKKPSPVPYLYILEKYGYDKKEALVVEDSVGGVKSAKDAGLLTVGLERVEGLHLEGVDVHIASLDELSDLLDGSLI